MHTHVIIKRKGFILNPLSSSLRICLLIFDFFLSFFFFFFSGAYYSWELMFLHCFSDAAFSVNSLNSFGLWAVFSFLVNFSPLRESTVCQLCLRLSKNLVVEGGLGKYLGKKMEATETHSQTTLSVVRPSEKSGEWNE